MDSKSKVASLVTVAFAEDLEHARQCQRLLREKNIEAVVRPHDPRVELEGVPVLVSIEFAAHAKDILARQAGTEDEFNYFGFDDAASDPDADE